MRPLKPQHSGLTTTDPALGHETRDISISGVIVFLAGLAFSFALIYIVLIGVYKYANDYADKQDKLAAQKSPWVKAEIERDAAALASQDQRLKERNIEPNAFIHEESAAIDRVKRFPLPRLQDDDVQEMEALRAAEDAQLNNLYYTDKGTGRVNIPIEQAMQIVVQRGLPAMQPPGATAPAKSAAGSGGARPSGAGATTVSKEAGGATPQR